MISPTATHGRIPFQGFSTYAWQALAIATVALALGLAVATDAYLAVALFGSAAAALALGVLFTYRRFGTLIAIWVFFLLQPLLVAVAGQDSAAGKLIDVVDIPILLVIGSLGILLAARHHATAVRWLLIVGGVVLACGVASDLAAGAPPTASVIGATFRMKPFLVLGAGLAVRWTPALATSARKVVIFSATIVGVTAIFDFASGGVLRNVFANPTIDTLRLGYVSAGGIFENLTDLNTFMAIAFTALLGMTWQGKSVRRVSQLVLVGLAALSTLRLKAVVALPVGAVALAATSRRVRSRLALATVLAALAVGAWTTLSHRNLVTEVVNLQVDRYTSETPRARQRLETTSIEIARNDFPLGVGFGRFGSAPSIDKETYSPIYAQYRLAQYYGFRPGDAIFVMDVAWAGLLGEVGVLGFLAFVAAILALMLLLFRRAREDGMQSDFAAIGFGVLAVVVLESLAGGAIFQSFMMLTALLFIAPGLWLVSDSDEYSSAGSPSSGTDVTT
jgi:hypothetical protein